MTDNFMSGWGMAKNKINKLVFICDNYKQAQIVYNNAKNRKEMKYINISFNYPYHLNSNKYLTQVKTKKDMKYFYIKDSFKK
tara:strand:+ start:78 stop:323 length:246 start_codon:yes stop_codon:yes gene_type:complete